jgi:hypothetical protein
MIPLVNITALARNNQKITARVAIFLALQCHGRGRHTANRAMKEKTTQVGWRMIGKTEE